MDSPAGQAARAQLEIVKVSVDKLASEAHELRQLLIRRTRVFLVAFSILALILGLVIVSASVALLDNRARITENNQKMCPILALMVPAPGDAPATTRRGQEIARRAAALARDPLYACPGVGQ